MTRRLFALAFMAVIVLQGDDQMHLVTSRTDEGLTVEVRRTSTVNHGLVLHTAGVPMRWVGTPYLNRQIFRHRLSPSCWACSIKKSRRDAGIEPF